MEQKFITFMLYSEILKKGCQSDEITSEDIKSMLNTDVNNAAIELYKKVIKLLSEENSYDKINYLIDNYNDIDFDNLLEDQKTYIKTRIKNDLKIRKNKGEIKYE